MSADHPYQIVLQKLDTFHQGAYKNGQRFTNLHEVQLLNLRLTVAGVPMEKSAFLYLENLLFTFDPGCSSSTQVSGTPMNGVHQLLLALPPKEPITNKTFLAMIVNYFGNGSKKKIQELQTPEAILAWAKDNPTEVLKLMGFYVPPSKAPASTSMEPTEKAKPEKKEPSIKIKAKKIEEEATARPPSIPESISDLAYP